MGGMLTERGAEREIKAFARDERLECHIPWRIDLDGIAAHFPSMRLFFSGLEIRDIGDRRRFRRVLRKEGLSRIERYG